MWRGNSDLQANVIFPRDMDFSRHLELVFWDLSG